MRGRVVDLTVTVDENTKSPPSTDLKVELKRIVDRWADTALKLREQDLKVMSRLAAAQKRLADAA